LPSEPYGTYAISANDTVPNVASDTFEIGASVTIDVDEGPTGTVVEVSGRGFSAGDIDTADVLMLPDPVECYVIDGPVDPGSNGEFTMEIVIPSVIDFEDDDHEIQVTGFGGNVTTVSFDVTGDAEIEVDPEFGVQGTTIGVEGWNFTQISAEDVILELWDGGYLVDITDEGDIETSSDGDFDETFRVPARNNGKYVIHAVQDDYNIEATVSFRIGTVVVILAVDEGVSGEKIVMTGTGFEDTGVAAWNATFDGDFLTEGDVDADGNLEIGGMVPTFWVPTKDPGSYEIEVYDIEADIAVSVEFSVTDKTMVETSPIVAPNDYNVTISGTYFTQDDTTELTFLLWNATDEWDIEVRQDGSATVEVQNEDDEGEWEAWWVVDDNETLSLGVYTLNVTDENDLYAMVQFEVVEKTLDIDPRKATFRIGDTVAFNIEVSFPADGSYIEIYDPTDELYWQTNVFSAGVWVKVGDTHIVPFYEQVAGGNPMILLDDAPLGEWSWTWFDVDDEELDSGVFMVSEAPEDVLSAQIEDLNTALTGLEEDIAGVQDEVAAVKTDIASAKAAADAAKAAADAATAAISDVASQAGDAKTSADAAKAAAEDAKSAATGLTTLVYGAIGASLVAALAAIVSLMQISRRIAG
jgi:outer membrane murein-binding lipoprotein Lpp